MLIHEFIGNNQFNQNNLKKLKIDTRHIFKNFFNALT